MAKQAAGEALRLTLQSERLKQHNCTCLGGLQGPLTRTLGCSPTNGLRGEHVLAGFPTLDTRDRFHGRNRLGAVWFQDGSSINTFVVHFISNLT